MLTFGAVNRRRQLVARIVLCGDVGEQGSEVLMIPRGCRQHQAALRVHDERRQRLKLGTCTESYESRGFLRRFVARGSLTAGDDEQGWRAAESRRHVCLSARTCATLTQELREARPHILEHLCQRLKHLLLELLVRARVDGLLEALEADGNCRLRRCLRHLHQRAANVLHDSAQGSSPRKALTAKPFAASRLGGRAPRLFPYLVEP